MPHPALRPFIEQLEVTIAEGHPIEEPARLAVVRGLPIIFTRKGLRGGELAAAIAVQLAYVALGFTQERRPFLPEMERLEATLAEAWAAKTLIPDAMAIKAAGERWHPTYLAGVCRATEKLARLRLRDAYMPRRQRPQALKPPGSP